ncbi:MAG: hypothetical protein ABI221_02970 [Candidatus Saccharimonadales bacterium]
MTEQNPFLTDQVPNLEIFQQEPITFVDLWELEELSEVPGFVGSDGLDLCYGNYALTSMSSARQLLTLKRAIAALKGAPKDLSKTDEEEQGALTVMNDLLEAASQGLQSEAGHSEPEQDNRKVLKSLLERRQTFVGRAEARRWELDQHKRTFAQRMHLAIDAQGLPLAHDQLDSRLDAVRLRFADPLELGGGVRGVYFPDLNSAHIRITSSSEQAQKTAFHELLHSVSAKAGKRHGLSVPGQRDTWLDEAITDVLALLLTDSKAFDYSFGNSVDPLWYAGDTETIWRHAGRNLDAFGRTYYEYKKAAINSLSRVPSKVLMDAYFKRNQDPHEADRRAGTHAERELQRTLKRTGGIGRIALMRDIDSLFREANRVAKDPNKPMQYGEKENARASKIASDIRSADAKVGLLADLRRAKHSRAVTRHTKEYQARLARAKTHK